MDYAWIDRFLAKFPDEPDEYNCWNWQGCVGPDGYGHFGSKSQSTQQAHRISYEFFRGPIAKGMTIDHLCRNRRCVNPDHLEVVSLKVNLARGYGVGALNARKTHCIRGHPLTGYNAGVTSNGGRYCRICNNASSLRRYHERRKLREAEVSR